MLDVGFGQLNETSDNVLTVTDVKYVFFLNRPCGFSVNVLFCYRTLLLCTDRSANVRQS